MRLANRTRPSSERPLSIRALCLLALGLLSTHATAQQLFPPLSAPRIAQDPVVRYPATLGFTSPGNPILLDRVFQGWPWYRSNSNANVRSSIGVDQVAPAGPTGYDLTGAGVRVGLWEVGGLPHSGHPELVGAVFPPLLPLTPQVAPLTDHATHVAGTIVATGVVPAAQGMAPGALVEAFTAADDTAEMEFASTTGLDLSNHSYNSICGWHTISDAMGTPLYSKWFGNPLIDANEDSRFGSYSDDSAEWDRITWSDQHYLPVVSAGNDRNDVPASGVPAFIDSPGGPFTLTFGLPPAESAVDGGYDTLPSDHSTAKNTLVVGAVGQMTSPPSAPEFVLMSSFSNWGPTDDGRIKPDVVAPGVNTNSSVLPPIQYGVSSGTSMAAPAVTGTLALLIEQFQGELGLSAPMASTLKAVLIHTALECGTDNGPDYRFGWGLVNAQGAADVIAATAAGDAEILEVGDFDGVADVYQVFPDPTIGDLRVTLAYTDRPSVPTVALDSPSRKLWNDLDIVLERRSSVYGSVLYFPWVLDPTDPNLAATFGDNDRDNVERIDPDQLQLDPLPGESLEWFVRVTAETFDASPPGVQPYSLVIRGARL